MQPTAANSFLVRFAVLPGPNVALASLDKERVRAVVEAHTRSHRPPPWLDAGRRLASGVMDVRRVTTTAGPPGPVRVVVSTRGRHGAHRPGVWAARFVARALAEHLGGTVVDPDAATLGPLMSEPKPRANGPLVSAREHLRVVTSGSGSGRVRLSVLGLANFGRPGLLLGGVPGPMAAFAGRFALGVAQHLIERDEPTTVIAAGRARFELRVMASQVRRGLGVAPQSGPDHWTRIGVTPSRHGDESRGRVWVMGPPLGAAAGVGRWLASGRRDLVGGDATAIATRSPQRRSSARR